MIHAEHVEGGGVEVVNVDGLVNSFEAEIVGGAVSSAAFDAAAGKDSGEAPAIVIAAVLELDQAADFDNGRAAELATNDNERFTE